MKYNNRYNKKHNKKYYKNTYGVIAALASLLWVSDLFAFGMGAAFMNGSETWADDLDPFHNGDRDVSSFGLVLDTNIAKDSLFGYRVTIATEDNEDTNGNSLDLDGMAFTHDFAFGVYRNSVVKVWLGPQLKFGFYGTTLNNSVLDEEGFAIGWGFGPVVGINIHLPKVVTFSASFAYHVVGFYVGDYDLYNSNGAFIGTRDIDVDYSGSTYLNLSVLFRFGADNFK